MKKLLSIILSLMLVASMCVCAFAEGNTVIDMEGKWYLCLAGMNVEINFANNGTYTIGLGLVFDDEEMAVGNWRLEDKDGKTLLRVYDESSEDDGMNTFVYDAETGCFVEDSDEAIKAYLSREALEPAIEIAAIKENAALEEFAGEWKTTTVYMMGIEMSPEEIGMDMLVNIDGEHVKMTSLASEEAITEEMDATYENGAMTLVLAEADEETEIEIVAVLAVLDDGTMSMAMDMMGISMTIVLSRNIEAE